MLLFKKTWTLLLSDAQSHYGQDYFVYLCVEILLVPEKTIIQN